MQAVILAWTGYWIGIGIELGIIVISGVVLALLLTGTVSYTPLTLPTILRV